jgi:hypothetical protein
MSSKKVGGKKSQVVDVTSVKKTAATKTTVVPPSIKTTEETGLYIVISHADDAVKSPDGFTIVGLYRTSYKANKVAQRACGPKTPKNLSAWWTPIGTDGNARVKGSKVWVWFRFDSYDLREKSAQEAFFPIIAFEDKNNALTCMRRDVDDYIMEHRRELEDPELVEDLFERYEEDYYETSADGENAYFWITELEVW